MTEINAHITHLLLPRIADDDEVALNVLFNQYCNEVYAIAYTVLQSEEKASLLLQRVFSDIWKNRNMLPEVYNFRIHLHVLLCRHLLESPLPGREIELLEAAISERSAGRQDAAKEHRLSKEKAAALFSDLSRSLQREEAAFGRWQTWLMALSVTAVIAVSVLWFNSYYNAFHTYTTKAGERRTFILPDGTKVILNSKSVLKLAGGYGDKKREVELKGEGYFEVKNDKARSFIVHTFALNIENADSAFSVRSYPEETKDIATNITGTTSVALSHKYVRDTFYHLIAMQKLVVAKEPQTTDDTASMAKVEPLGDCAEDGTPAEISWITNKQ